MLTREAAVDQAFAAVDQEQNDPSIVQFANQQQHRDF